MLNKAIHSLIVLVIVLLLLPISQYGRVLLIGGVERCEGLERVFSYWLDEESADLACLFER